MWCNCERGSRILEWGWWDESIVEAWKLISEEYLSILSIGIEIIVLESFFG